MNYLKDGVVYMVQGYKGANVHLKDPVGVLVSIPVSLLGRMGYIGEPEMRTPNILFVGAGRAGKDEACRLFANATGWVNAGTCSKYLAPHVAVRLGIPEERAYAERHDNRLLWRQIGDEVRKDNPLALVMPMMQAGRIGGGVRGLAEIRAAREICTLIVWVVRPGNLADPTLEYGEEETDITLVNDAGLDELDTKLRRLARIYAH